MIIVGTRLLVIEMAISRLLFFFIFTFIYDKSLLSKFQKYLLFPILYFLSLLMEVLANDFVGLIYILIMYYALNKNKVNNFYLINSIILSFLITIFASIISSGFIVFLHGFLNLDDVTTIMIFLLFEFIMASFVLLIYKINNINYKFKEIDSWTLTVILSYLLILLTVFIYFVQKLKAYTTLISGILAFLIIQSIAMLLIYIYESNRQKEKFKYRLMKEELTNLEFYTKQLDNDQKEMHKFRHDYKNILLSLNEISDNNSDTKLKKTLVKLGIYSNTYFNNISMDDFKDLEFVTNPYIKTILISKLKSIKSENVNCYFECKNDIDRIDIDIFDLIRILGVSIDNALEETQKQKDGKIQIIMIEQKNQVDITIKNTISKKLSLSQIKEYGFSTKKNHSGIGMVNIQNIKKKYRNLLIYYDIIDNWFCIQISIINKGDYK